MKENLKPLMILFGFVAAVVCVFFLETKFLVPKKNQVSDVAPGTKKEEKKTIAGELREILDDFENAGSDLKETSIFKYGSLDISGSSENTKGKGYSGKNAIKVLWSGKENFGGWGKGIGKSYSFDLSKHHVNFFVLYPKGEEDQIKVVFQDDDNMDNSYNENDDDAWGASITLKPSPEWQLISIPMKDLKDGTKGGDGKFNTGEGQGNLITFLFEFTRPAIYNKESVWYFDHVSITEGALPIGKDISEIPVTMAGMYK